MRAFLSPLRGWRPSLFAPTAYAVGCILSPLRGWHTRRLGWAHHLSGRRYAAPLLVSLLVFCLLQLANAQKDAPAKESAPDVPDAIQVPAGLEPVLFAHAKGSQIYTCQADADGKYSWTLKAPEAELHDRNDKVIGEHSAGPTWKLKDGSEVTGKAAAHIDSLDDESIPWLLVNVVNNSGKGQLAKVTTIQRVHTHGGKPSGDVCDEAHKGSETKAAYTADYYFFAPAK